MNFEDIADFARAARQGVADFRRDGLSRRPEFYRSLSRLIRENSDTIRAENEKDLARADEFGLSSAMKDRLRLTPERIEDLAKSVDEIGAQPDPLAPVEGKTLPNGLLLQKVRVGIGVVGFIYESRPNVTIDAVALCVKSGNAVMLKGGKEAAFSNVLLAELCRRALREAGLPEALATMLDCTDRSVVSHLAKQAGLVDVVIPRGGKGLIQHVVKESLVPVLKHFDGNCHVYVHEKADLQMALNIVDNAKTQRPGVCNAMETLLVDESVIGMFLPRVAEVLGSKGVEFRACPKSKPFLPGAKAATEDDWATEYADMILAVKAVSNLREAIDHITKYGSGHTESIVTSDLDTSRDFLAQVDSSAVMVNASTRFNDGGMFGFGAEMGISTDKIHARGPMGAEHLTTYKYQVIGRGHVRG